jgi:shikimate kinase
VPNDLYLLVGLKGSGKSYIGALIGRSTDIHFFRVEEVWLSLPPGEDGWTRVEAEIDRQFETHAKVMIETLGAGPGFAAFHVSLQKKYALKYIHVRAGPDQCLERVHARDQSLHLSVSDEKVLEYNRAAAQVTLPWDLEIDNTGFGHDEAIIRSVLAISTEG